MAIKPNLLQSVGDTLRNKNPEVQKIAEEYELGRTENPGELVLERVQQLGNFLNETFGWRRRNPDGTPISQERKEKQAATIKFLGDMLPRDPVEGMAGGFIRPLSGPIRTIYKQLTKKGAKSIATIGEDIVSGTGSIRQGGRLKSFTMDVPYENPIKYKYSAKLIKTVRNTNRTFDKMTHDNINLLNLRLFDRGLSKGGAASKGYKKVATSSAYEFDDEIGKIWFEKVFTKAQKGKLNFNMRVRPLEENAMKVELQSLLKDGSTGPAYLNYQIAKNSEGVHVISDVHFYASSWKGNFGRMQAQRLGFQLVDQVPNNAIIKEHMLTMDSLTFLLGNALRSKGGMQTIHKVTKGYHARRMVSEASDFSQASQLAKGGDTPGLFKLIKGIEAKLIKKGKIKGKVDKLTGEVLDSEIDFQLGTDHSGAPTITWNMFEIRHLKMLMASIAGYNSYNAYKNTVTKKSNRPAA